MYAGELLALVTRLDCLAVKDIVAIAEAWNWVDESEQLNIDACEPKPTDCCCEEQPVAYFVQRNMLYVLVDWQTPSADAAS